MSRTTTLCAAACLLLAGLVRAVVGQEPTLAPPQETLSPSDAASNIKTTSGETLTQGPTFAAGETPPAGPAAQGIPGYPSVRYPTTAFPNQAPPPEPKPPTDPPPGLLDSAESLYRDGIEPMLDGAGEWFSENWGGECPVGPRKWAAHGWFNPGYSWNPDYPNNGMNTPVAFNDRANEPMLNQLYGYIERRVDPNGCTWDHGMRADFMFGSDQRFMTATGLELHQDNSPKWTSQRFYGLAMPQLYAEIAAPVANGLTLKVGHFYSIFGFERVAAPDSFFYSHSYARVYGMPATHTGALMTVYLKPNRFFKDDNFTLMTGITQGWDVWAHQNKDLAWLAGFMAEIGDLGITLSGAFIAGQEPVTNLGPGFPFGAAPFLTRDRWGWNLILSKQLTEKLGVVVEHVGGSQNAGVATTIAGVTTTSEAVWYGFNNYLIYEVNDMWAGAMRFEWFHDQDHYRVARAPTATAAGLPFINGAYFNFTMGLNWRPRPNVVIRPEMRWDWSDVQGNTAPPQSQVFDDGSDGSQFLWATDIIVSF